MGARSPRVVPLWAFVILLTSGRGEAREPPSACAELLRAPLASGNPLEALRSVDGVAVGDDFVHVPRGPRGDGWLGTVRCPGGAPELAWLVAAPAGYVAELPWRAEARERGEFLTVQAVRDFDHDGQIEALVVGTGGFGMYFHYPIVLRLTRQGRWQVLFWPQKPFFYGDTEVLSSARKGTIKVAVTSVDERLEANEWMFSTCSACPHPFVRRVYRLRGGRLQLEKATPVPSRERTLSDFLGALRRRQFARARRSLAAPATIGGRRVATTAELKAAVKYLGFADEDWFSRTGRGGCALRPDAGEVSTQEVQGQPVAVMPARANDDVLRLACGFPATRLVAVFGEGARLRSLRPE